MQWSREVYHDEHPCHREGNGLIARAFDGSDHNQAWASVCFKLNVVRTEVDCTHDTPSREDMVVAESEARE